MSYKKPDGGPAFPPAAMISPDEAKKYVTGITLRDYIAIKAMAAIIGKNKLMTLLEKDVSPKESEYMRNFMEVTAHGAYGYADAMLREREKE